ELTGIYKKVIEELIRFQVTGGKQYGRYAAYK
ncbi:unnamed protein product, partial [marine sediment metagenome]